MNRICLGLLVALSGCTAARLATTRTTVANQTQCPEAKLNVWEGNEGYWADGCGARYLCQVPQGPCAERLTQAQVLARTRQTFSRETGCFIADVTVTPTNRGLVAQGCGRYSVCSSSDGPCMPSRPPTCSEVAQERYDYCLNAARSDGNRGSWGVGKWGVAAMVANNYLAGKQSEREAGDCKQRYDTEAAHCGAASGPNLAPAPPPPPPPAPPPPPPPARR
jgi:hypothetical protein